MKQDRKIWLLILGVVILGMGITFLTKSYVSSRQKELSQSHLAQYADSSEEMATEPPESEKGEDGGASPLSDAGPAVAAAEAQAQDISGPGAAPAGPPGSPDTVKSRSTSDAADGISGRTAGGLTASDSGEGAAAPEAPGRAASGEALEAPPFPGDEAGMADLAPALLAEADPDSSPEAEESAVEEKKTAEWAVESAEDYQTKLKECENRLAELDIQIERMRSQETENTLQSVKSAARTEQGIWERELDSVYVLLVTSLDEGQGELLRASQQQWIEARDAAALEAARKGGGGSLESVEYIASIAASTRLRVYELVKQYQ